MTDYPLPKACRFCASRGTVERYTGDDTWDFVCTECGVEHESLARPLPPDLRNFFRRS